MPRPDTQGYTLFVVALCAAVAAMAADRSERPAPPAAPATGVAFAAQLGDAAVSLSWR